MKIYAHEEHLKELIHSGAAGLVDAQLCFGFESHIRGLPWLGSGLDWSSLMPPSTLSLNLSNASDQQVMSWIQTTRIGCNSHLVAFFGGEQPGIVLDAVRALKELDVLYWKAPGRQFMFGARPAGLVWQPAYDDFLEYDGADTVTALTAP